MSRAQPLPTSAELLQLSRSLLEIRANAIEQPAETRSREPRGVRYGFDARFARPQGYCVR